MIEKLEITKLNDMWIVMYDGKRCTWLSKSGYESRKEAVKVMNMIASCMKLNDAWMN